MKRLLPLALLLSVASVACVDQEEAPPVVECGPRPVRPSVTPRFTRYEVIMRPAEWAALIQYAIDAEEWGLCIAASVELR